MEDDPILTWEAGKSKYEETWQQVLVDLLADMPRASFSTWVRDANVVSLEKNVLIISAHKRRCPDWLESCLASTVQNILKGILDRPVSVRFVASEAPQEDEQEKVAEEEKQSLTSSRCSGWIHDRIVQPHKQVVVKGYLRRLGMEIGPKGDLVVYLDFIRQPGGCRA